MDTLIRKDEDIRPQRLLFAEPGINWRWFTLLDFHPNAQSVTILWYDRRHLGEMKYWPSVLRRASVHPGFSHESIWKEKTNRIAVEYHVPKVGWCIIRNPLYIFDYQLSDLKEWLSGINNLTNVHERTP